MRQSWSGKLFVDQLEVADGEFEIFSVLILAFTDVEAQTENRCRDKFFGEGDGDFVDTVVFQSRAADRFGKILLPRFVTPEKVETQRIRGAFAGELKFQIKRDGFGRLLHLLRLSLR